MKEILIHFTDVEVCFASLKELGIKIKPETKKQIKMLHDSVYTIIKTFPNDLVAEVCYRVANRIIRIIEFETSLKFVKYKKSNYLLS